MKVLRIETVDLRRVKLPDLTGQPLTRGQVDPIQRPVFRELSRASDKGRSKLELVLGRRLAAACMREAKYRIEADIVHCDSAEALRFELVDRAVWLWYYGTTEAKYAVLKQLVVAYEAVAAREIAERSFDPTKERRGNAYARYGAVGRPKSARRRALQLTAAALGGLVSEKTLVRSFWAAENGRVAKLRDFETYGLLEPTDAFLHRILAARKYIERSAKGVATAQRSLTLMGEDPDTEDLLKSLRKRAASSLASLSEELGNAYPRGLCPYCKGVPGAQEACGDCLGRGWIGKLKTPIPKELTTRPPHIYVDGNLVAVADLLKSVAS